MKTLHSTQPEGPLQVRKYRRTAIGGLSAVVGLLLASCAQPAEALPPLPDIDAPPPLGTYVAGPEQALTTAYWSRFTSA